MMFIRIARRPIGHAPEWVRDAWIGLSLPTPQRSPRSLQGLSVLSRSGGGLFPLLDTLRGKRPRVSGFIVNGKAAVDLLAETQPAAAEWWRTNAPTFLTGRQFLIFDSDCCEHLGGTPSVAGLLWGSSRFRKAYPASPGRIALLWVIATLVRILDAMLFPGEEMRSVSSILYLGGTAIFAALLAAWVLRLRGSTLHLVSALVSLDLFMTCIAFGMKFISPTPIAAYWLLAGLYSVVIANIIGRGFSGLRSKKRRATAILLVLAANIGAESLQAADGAFWQLASVVRPLFGRPDPFAQEDNRPPEIDADLLWGAQPALVQKQISALRPRTANTMNVYAMAVAGSGTQALFSREAHEALRAAALHFGDGSRGGALVSNGAVDLMKAPLATRDNIAAVAKALARSPITGRIYSSSISPPTAVGRQSLRANCLTITRSNRSRRFRPQRRCARGASRDGSSSFRRVSRLRGYLRLPTTIRSSSRQPRRTGRRSAATTAAASRCSANPFSVAWRSRETRFMTHLRMPSGKS